MTNKIKILDNTSIKLIAISIMLFNHIGYVFFNGAPIFLKIGEIAFPLFAFFIAEGFYYTRNRKKYLRNLFIYALISEVIFDYALYKHINMFHQNVLFTFCFAVILLMIYEYIIKTKLYLIEKALLITLVLILFSFLSTLTYTDHNTYGVLLIFIYYIFRDQPIIKYTFAALILLSSFKYGYALISIPILLLYNGKKGYNLKYFFYTFYPAHLLILIIIRALIS